ncbi:MAG: Spx/MgsR family RNA polymerase-binding regulatory protein [Parachlamydia sp.]|jgi:Spx/MgsR family transcriptional regulator|nr:Spx/MgsR family RNA polymerase-binding regulatory protein [Parachlamydia sp.]
MKIYLYSKCTTCQQALRFLNDQGIAYTKIEIVETPPTIEELHAMLAFQNGNLKKLFNTSGQLYRGLNLAAQLETLSLDEALQLLHTHGMLVKRPFLINKIIGLTGFDPLIWKERLKA